MEEKQEQIVQENEQNVSDSVAQPQDNGEVAIMPEGKPKISL